MMRNGTDTDKDGPEAQKRFVSTHTHTRTHTSLQANALLYFIYLSRHFKLAAIVVTVIQIIGKVKPFISGKRSEYEGCQISCVVWCVRLWKSYCVNIK